MYLDLSKRGLRVAFQTDWQVEVMEAIWNTKSLTSLQAYKLSLTFGEQPSRTSVIYFLNRMVAEGLLSSEPITLEGHLQFLYKAKELSVRQDDVVSYPFDANEGDFKKYLIRALEMALMEVPEGG
jgi:hypothetical protein